MRKLIFLTLLFLSSTVFAEDKTFYIANKTNSKITIKYTICKYIKETNKTICDDEQFLNIYENKTSALIIDFNIYSSFYITNIEYNNYNIDTIIKPISTYHSDILITTLSDGIMVVGEANYFFPFK
jgi:hypothetical protein